MRSLLLTLLLITPTLHANAADVGGKARVCSTLGKVHAQRDRELFPVRVQSLDGRLLVNGDQACVEIEAGKHTLGLIAAVRGAGFRARANAQGGLKEQALPIELEARHTYTLAAQLDDRFEETWIPLVQRVEAW